MFSSKELEVIRKVFEIFVDELDDVNLEHDLGLTRSEYEELTNKLS